MCGDVPRSVFQNPLILHSNLKTNTIMYLKYIRHKRQWGDLQRGTLYTVHLEPNEKGGYNEHLRLICDVYEICPGALLPMTLIYPVGMRRIDGRMRLVFGSVFCQSMLYLIEFGARERFFMELYCALHEHEEVRLEVAEND